MTAIRPIGNPYNSNTNRSSSGAQPQSSINVYLARQYEALKKRSEGMRQIQGDNNSSVQLSIKERMNTIQLLLKEAGGDLT